MEHHGIIYRTGKKSLSARRAEENAELLSAGRNAMHGSWRLSGINKEQEILILPYDDPAAMRGKLTDKELLISYFPDSTFTQVGTTGNFLTGRWSYDQASQSVLLTVGRKTEEVLLTLQKAPNGQRVMSFDFGRKQAMLLLEDGKPILDFQDDPFYWTNNQWRIKPTKPENKRQLVRRLRNYLLHTAYVLKAAQIREKRRVSLEFSDGIAKLYNVGIGIVKPDKIPQTWIDGFYSREDAIKAYDIYEDYLLNAKHKKSRTGKWIRDDYNILVDIHNGLASW